MSPTKRPNLRLESLDDRIVPSAVDLTAVGAGATVNGAIVHRMDSTWNAANGDQAYGRGQLRTVLTMTNNGVEQGYNTNYRPIQAGMNSSSAADETRSLLVGRVPVVTVGSTQYYEFVLNVNEPSGLPGRNISVDELRLYTSDRGNLRNYSSSAFTLGGVGASTMVYDMDAGDATNALSVRAKTNTAAVGEIAVLVPVSALQGATDDMFVYIYSKMSGAGGGAEQWGVRKDPPVVPPPTSGVTMQGNVFNDMNFNGQYDEGEGLAGVTLVFSGTDFNDNNVFPDGDLFVTTGIDGFFSFSGPVAGNYQLGIWGNGGFDPQSAVVGDANNDGIYGEQGVDGETASNESIINILLEDGANGVGYGFIMGNSGG